jgi:hypothetical protein
MERRRGGGICGRRRRHGETGDGPEGGGTPLCARALDPPVRRGAAGAFRRR